MGEGKPYPWPTAQPIATRTLRAVPLPGSGEGVADNLNDRGPADRARINVTDPRTPPIGPRESVPGNAHRRHSKRR